MSINKNALIRYKTLDKCFRSSNPFTIDKLVEKCRQALHDEAIVRPNPLCEAETCPCSASVEKDFSCPCVSRRQVQQDITFMLSEAGWGIELVCADDRKRVYQYKDPDYSIFNEPFSEEEMQNIKETVLFLSKFGGLPKSQMLANIVDSISERYSIDDTATPIIAFQNNPYLKGVDEHFSNIFTAIQNKKVFDVAYRPFTAEQDEKHIVHPYQLKQYNNRWFMIGWDEKAQKIWNFPLDRIQKTKESKKPYEEADIEIDEFFDDVIGVSVPPEGEKVEITLRVATETVPYLVTKPLHHSQQPPKEIEGDDKHKTIKIKLIPNYEFYSQILQYGEAITIIAPEEVKDEIKKKINQLYKNYL